MEKIVSNGYRDCTVLLDGTECRVTFDHCYPAFAVMNDSTEYVFVSIEQGKQPGEDGVRRIAPGGSSVIAHMRTNVDTVYVTGLGSVQISAQNGTENPFRPQSGGGDTTINGNVVTPSAVNGNIKIDGVEVEVYDDTDIKKQLAGIGSGVSPTVNENENNTDELYRLDITDVNGTFTTPNLKGEQGVQGLQGVRGEKGEQGEQGLQGIQGIKGDKGDDGYPFLIYKEYSSLDEFDAAHFPEIGLMFMVKTGENFPVYRYTGDADTPYSFVTELATSEGIKGEKGDKGDTGEQGIQGEAGKDGADGTTYTPRIGTVENSEEAFATVVIDEENKQAVFNFGLPKGADGEKAVQFTPVITDDNELAWENDGGLENPPTVPIQQIFSNAPIGTVLSFAGQAAPNGYLLCDGASYAVADYPDLYAVIGNTYGGDTENFNVPDYRETVLVGVGVNTTDIDAIASHDVYGLGEFKDDQFQGHWHNLGNSNGVVTSSLGASEGGGSVQGANPGGVNRYLVNTALDAITNGTNGEPRVGATTHGKQKGVTYIIKAKYEGVEIEANGITVDSVLNSTSTNPVQNKAIVEALADKANLSDIPESLPANGGNADTVGGLHANEIASNPNLLINPDFRVNQRGQTEYTSVGYTADRWYMAYPNKVEITENGIKIHNINARTNNAWMIQMIEFIPAGTYTLTVKLRKSRADMLVRVYTSGAKSTTEWQTVTANFTITADYSNYQLQIATTDSDSGALTDDWVEIAWVKLELGSIATQFIPPDPATELVKCQRYYQIHSSGDINPVDLRPNMRITPTITQLSDGNYAYDAEIY